MNPIEKVVEMLEQLPEETRAEIISTVLKKAFTTFREGNKLPTLIGSLLDAQAVLVLRVSDDGEIEADYSMKEDATDAACDLINATMRGIGAIVGTYPDESESSPAVEP